MKKRQNRNIWKWMMNHKVFTAILLGGVVTVGGYSWWSVTNWQQYAEGYKQALAQSKTAIDAAFALPQTTDEEKAKKITSLTKVAEDQSIPECQIPVLLEWQKVFENVRSMADACTQKATESSDLQQALKAIAVYLEDEQVLIGKLAANDAPNKLDESKFEAQAAEWEKVKNDVASTHTSEPFQPVKAKAQEAASAIHGAWQRLVDTNKAQDQAAYEEARAKLPESYDMLAAIAPAANAQLVSLTQAFQSAYAKVFS